jgi:hypothetical protein
VSDSAGVCEKQRNISTSFSASTPPVSTVSARPLRSSPRAIDSAASELAHAASSAQLVPPRSKRLATRPAMTLPSRPGNVLSCHGTNWSAMASHAFSTTASFMPIRRRPSRHIGRAMRPDMWATSCVVAAAPRMTLVRCRSKRGVTPLSASARQRCAMSSASSWATSVLGRLDGGRPKAKASKGCGGTNPPRRP